MGEEVFGVVWLEMAEFSSFWCFWAILAVFDRVLSAVIVVGGVVKSEEVTDGVDEEKPAKTGEISLVG